MDNQAAKKRGRPSARDKILDAALALVREVGAPALTLDGVAERAGVSKGGLLYHFPFKEQLLTAANEDIVRRLVAAREAEAAHLPDSPSRTLKAYVLASVYNRAGNDQITTKLLAAGSMLKESADPIRQYWMDRFPELAADIGFDRAALVHAATEGLWFMEMLRLSPFSDEQRARLVEIILAIVDDAPLTPAAEGVEVGKQKEKPAVPRKSPRTRVIKLKPAEAGRRAK
jgi:AcrR family transcriptional regulator